MKLKGPVSLHPFILGLSPVLFLYSRNIKLITFSDLMLAIGGVLFVVTATALLLTAAVRCRERRSLMTTAFLILLLGYANFVSFLTGRLDLGLGRNSGIFLLLWAVLVGGCMYFISRLKRSAGSLNKIANVFAVTLVTFSMVQIAVSWPEKHTFAHLHISPDPLPAASVMPDPLPNIYFIILDQHVGNIALSRYGYDNSKFVKALEDRGFYMARESRSNYWKTRASLSSTLNIKYFLAACRSDVNYDDPDYCTYLRAHNRVFDFLKRCGYTTIQCRTDVAMRFDVIPTVDILLDTRANHSLAFLGLLSKELLSNTPFYKILSDLTDDNQEVEHRDLFISKIRRSIRNGLETTRQMAHREGPFVLFTHFFTPHMPATFTESGDYPGTPSRFDDFDVRFCDPGNEETLRSYLAQMEFMDRQIIEVIDYIQEHSEQPPIIILQGDHGNRFKTSNRRPVEEAAPELYSILNAMYLPGCDYSALYPSISSVNTFPVIFNHYFGTDIPLLEDRSFYLTPGESELEDVTSFIDP